MHSPNRCCIQKDWVNPMRSLNWLWRSWRTTISMASVFESTAGSGCNRVKRGACGERQDAIEQALPPAQWHSRSIVRSAAMLVALAAIVPRGLVVIAVVIAIVITLMLMTRPRDDAGG